MIKIIVDSSVFYLSDSTLKKYKNFNLNNLDFVERQDANVYIIDTDPNVFSSVVALMRGYDDEIDDETTDLLKKLNLNELIPNDDYFSTQDNNEIINENQHDTISIEDNKPYTVEMINEFNKLNTSNPSIIFNMTEEDINTLSTLSSISDISKYNKCIAKPKKIELNINNA